MTDEELIRRAKDRVLKLELRKTTKEFLKAVNEGDWVTAAVIAEDALKKLAQRNAE